MVDPISVISLVEGSIGLVLQCGSVVRTLSDIKAKFKHAEIAIMSLIDEVETIQFAWSRIKEWSEDHTEAATDTRFVQRLEKSLQCGTIVLSALEQDLADYKDVADNASFIRRSKMAWNERAFLDHQHRVRGQVQAMSLLLQVSQLSTSKSQTKLLKKKEEAFRPSDESAYSIVPSRMSSRMSLLTRSRDSLLSRESKELVYNPLSFEDDLFTARVYKRNYRHPGVNSLFNLQKGKKREAGGVSTEDSEDGPSLQMPPSGMTTPTTMSVDFSQPYAKIQEMPLRDLRPVPPSPASTKHERSLMIAKFVPSTLKERSCISTGVRNAAIDTSIKAIHPLELQPDISSAIGPAAEKIQQRDNESVVGIVRKSSEPKAQYDMNYTLLSAVAEGNLDEVRTLIDRGARVNPHNSVGRPPLHLAVFRGDVSMTNLLLQNGANCAQKWHGIPPIHLACENSDFQIARLLLDAGASVISLDALQQSPLHIVLSLQFLGYGTSDLIELFVSRGADVNAHTQAGETPLHMSCKYVNLDHVKALLGGGADPNAVNGDGRTALHLLASAAGYPLRNHRAIFRLLHKYGANIDAEDKLGDTLFHLLTRGYSLDRCVSWIQYYDLVKVLLEHGVNVNAQNKAGDTPLHILVTQKRKDQACWIERRDVIRLLLAYGVNIDAQNSGGDTPLHILVRDLQGATSQLVFRSLIKHEAQINIQNRAGDTLLHILARRGHSMEMDATWMGQIHWLLDADADIFIKNLMQETPWQSLGQSVNGRVLRHLAHARPQHKSMSEYDEDESGVPF